MTVCVGLLKIFTNKLVRSNKLVSIFIMLSIIIILLVVLIINTNCDCSKDPLELVSEDQHVLCLIVPFRDRFDELLLFLAHMKEFLHKQNVQHQVFVVNQVGDQIIEKSLLISL